MKADSLSIEEFDLFTHLAKDFVDRGMREWRPERLSITLIGLGRPGVILPALYSLVQKGRVLQTEDGVFSLTPMGRNEARDLIS